MKQYRIKEDCTKFYPQYKNGWRTLWTWAYIRNNSGITCKILYQCVGIHEWSVCYLDSLEEAKEFLEKYKHKTKIHYEN